jgi:hypothetical protein
LTSKLRSNAWVENDGKDMSEDAARKKTLRLTNKAQANKFKAGPSGHAI